jgi:hypothetical protein
MGMRQGNAVVYSHLSLTHALIADIDLGFEDYRCALPPARPLLAMPALPFAHAHRLMPDAAW